MKREPAKTAAVDLLPNKSHATANISLLAPLQKLSTATFKREHNHPLEKMIEKVFDHNNHFIEI